MNKTQAQAQEIEEKERCPRCGKQGTRFERVVNGKIYVYYRHYDPETKKTRQCYIGPANEYEHAAKLHQLPLTNLGEQDYIEIAAQAILRAIQQLEKQGIDPQKALQQTIQKIKEKIEKENL